MFPFSKHARDERGAAAVEFALVVSVLFMLVFGIIEFGRAFNELEVMNSAAREGARVAAVGGTADEARARVMEASSPYEPDGAVDAGTCTELGAPVTVSWTQEIEISLPLLPAATQSVPIKGVFRCEVDGSE